MNNVELNGEELRTDVEMQDDGTIKVIIEG